MYKLEFRKEDLLSLPANERVFLIYAGHALNELNILCRMIVFAMPVRRGEAERQFMVIQSTLLMRTLAGKLHEMWVLFNKTYYKSKLSSTIKEELSEDTILALKELNAYFNKPESSISTVRHKHAFHYDVAQVDAGLEKIPQKWPLDIYFDKTSANTIYGFADGIINSAVIAAIDSGTLNSSFEMLWADTQIVAKSFQAVLEGVFSTIINKRLAHKIQRKHVQTESAGFTKWTECELPTFVHNPSPWSVTLQNGTVLSWAGQNLDAPAFLRNLLE